MGSDESAQPTQATITKIKQDSFLAAFSVSGTLKASAEAIDTPRSTIQAWIRRDVHGFKDKFKEATELFREYLQNIAVERVKLQKPNDNPVLLITLLNAHWPEKYRRDSHYADNAAKEVMADWKRFMKENKKAARAARFESGEEPSRDLANEGRERALAEAEKILERVRWNGNSDD